MAKLVTCLFFSNQAEEAATFYTSVFPNSSIGHVSRSQGAVGDQQGAAMMVSFTLNDHPFLALNSRPATIDFTEAISFQIMCDDQAEVDHYWDTLSDGGDPTKQRCGWLMDKYGVSWQVVPRMLSEVLGNADPAKRQRGMAAFIKMKKLVIQDLLDAVDGVPQESG